VGRYEFWPPVGFDPCCCQRIKAQSRSAVTELCCKAAVLNGRDPTAVAQAITPKVGCCPTNFRAMWNAQLAGVRWPGV
jgi:hypothetical protein